MSVLSFQTILTRLAVEGKITASIVKTLIVYTDGKYISNQLLVASTFMTVLSQIRLEGPGRTREILSRLGNKHTFSMRLGFLFLLSSGNARGSIPESDYLLLATFSEYVANLGSLQQIIFNYLSRLNLLLILGHYYLSF